MYRLEIRRRLRVPNTDYRQEKQDLLQKELKSVIEKHSQIAVRIVTQPAPVTGTDLVTRRGRELSEIDQRLKIEMLLLKARTLTAQKTGRSKNRRQKKKGQEKKRDDQQKKRDDREKQRDGKQGKKRGREEEDSGCSESGKRKRA